MNAQVQMSLTDTTRTLSRFRYTVIYPMFLLLFCLILPQSGFSAAPKKAELDACTAAKDSYINTLKDLINMDSGTADFAELNAKKEYLVAALTKHGAKVDVLDAPGVRSGTANIVATLKGNGKAKILVLAHYDTVWPKGEAAKRPFRIENETAYGPGVGDMQHSVAATVTLFEIIKKLNYKKFDTLTVLLNADEEKGSRGSKELIMAEAAKHDVVFSMEGGGEKADEVIISARGVCQVRLTVKGRAAHSGENPGDGINAGVELAHQMLQMLDFSNKEKNTDANWTIGSYGIKSNVIPDTAKATMDIRISMASEADRAEALARERIKNTRVPGAVVELEFYRGRPPFEPNPLTDKLGAQAAAIFKKELGQELKLVHMGAATDANYAYQKAPVLEGMGMGGGNWHALTEFVPMKTIPNRLYLLVRMIQETCDGKTVPIGTAPR